MTLFSPGGLDGVMLKQLINLNAFYSADTSLQKIIKNYFNSISCLLCG